MNTASPIYLDHSATTPVLPEVIEAMLPYWTDGYGNPSSSHASGQKAHQGLETARRTIARFLNARPSEIIFTGCGSESDNLALRGPALATHLAGKPVHIVTSCIEHEAVLETAEQLHQIFGFELTLLGVDRFGRVDPQAVANALRPETVVVSIMAANNEIGTLQPIEAIGHIVREHGALFHTDAVQAASTQRWDLATLPIDMLSLAPHKFYGPKGIGILYVREGTSLVPMLTGGGQENGRRAGTSNVPFAVGAATAFELAQTEQAAYIARCTALRDRLINGLQALFAKNDMCLTGHPELRLPYHASVAFRDVDANDLLMHLDLAGIAASSGSACSTGNPEPSHILEALGLDEHWTRGALRLTVGHQTTAEQIDRVLEVLPTAVAHSRRFTSSYEVTSP